MFNKLKNIIKNSSIFKHYCEWEIDQQEFARFLAEVPPQKNYSTHLIIKALDRIT